MNETPKTKPGWRLLRWILISMAVLATLVAIFYTEENWRGKRAWENYKHELEAKGVVLDWNAYIPPPVPDDQNFFKAPKMAEWFIRLKSGVNLSNELTARLTAGFHPKQYQIAELTILPVLTNALRSENADMVLRYNPLGTAFFLPGNAMDTNGSSTEPRIPLIKFQDVPITMAIENLALQAGINYMLDPKINFGVPDQNGKIEPEPKLSFQWADISGREALLAVLTNYNLQLIYDPKTNIARITMKDSNAPKIYATPDVHDRLEQLFAGVIGTNAFSDYKDYAILVRPPQDIKPMRIFLESDAMPAANEIRKLFAESFPSGDAKYYAPRISVESDGTNTFRVLLDAASAANYLLWSDQFEPDFNLIREALQRPFARMDGDYTVPYEIPVPNFVASRMLAQLLAQRVKCQLRLGQPEQALHEITLLNDSRKWLEAAPTGKPMTLVAAMINVAITGLDVETIEDGFRLNGWQEPQLAALQEQLQKIKLVPLVFEAFKEEQAHIVNLGEKANLRRDFRKVTTVEAFGYGQKATLRQKLEAHAYGLMPQGWILQNIVVATEIHQRLIDTFDPMEKQVFPKKLEEAYLSAMKKLEHHSMFHLLADISIANYSKAFQNVAYNQTRVNQAQIACALERYHLAHGEYPATLEALAPQFIVEIPHDIIGGQPLHYRRTEDGKFLLYSIGWNETDDGGLPGTLSDVSQGDWVWQYPQK